MVKTRLDPDPAKKEHRTGFGSATLVHTCKLITTLIVYISTFFAFRKIKLRRFDIPTQHRYHEQPNVTINPPTVYGRHTVQCTCSSWAPLTGNLAGENR